MEINIPAVNICICVWLFDVRFDTYYSYSVCILKSWYPPTSTDFLFWTKLEGTESEHDIKQNSWKKASSVLILSMDKTTV